MGDDQCPTEGDSRQRGTREPLQRVTDVGLQAPQSWTRLADGLAASGSAVTLVRCSHDDGRLWPGGRQRSAPTRSDEVVWRWCVQQWVAVIHTTRNERLDKDKRLGDIRGQRADYWSGLVLTRATEGRDMGRQRAHGRWQHRGGERCPRWRRALVVQFSSVQLFL